MNLFLAEELNESGGHLGKEESHHASRVLRLGAGAAILATSGEGIIYRSEISSASKSQMSFKNLEVLKQEGKGPRLHIAIAPTKSNDRFEFFIEKATEIGISEITPIICSNSERKVYKAERGQKIMASAAKQSLACWWPKLNEPIRFSEFLARKNASEKFIAHCQKDDLPNILTGLSHFSDVSMLIGPEGDFTANEIEMAKAKSYRECSLGNKRLRTETAGLAVVLAFGLR